MSALRTGNHVGSYEIVEAIGAGGMGEVFRARDSKLKRDVAVKVLPGEFLDNAERVARFQREAEVLATLNHPNIAQIYGLEESGPAKCIVLEFVAGETLQERIRRGPLPLDEALEIAGQIAQGFEAAHEKGIVHRDLKPANIKITPTGQVKVLDFGLAKIADFQRSEDLTHSPTMLSQGTAQGVILGTTAYMSPEQAKGRPADARSDVWAFGVVLYEMLTGQATFSGETVIEILGSVLKSEPEWKNLPPGVSTEIRTLLRRCLQKDRKRRFHCMADVRLQIEEAADAPVEQRTLTLAELPRRRSFPWIAAVLASALAGAGLTAVYSSYRAKVPVETHLQIITPVGDVMSYAVSPDGRKVVYEGVTDGKRQLWLRLLDSDTPQILQGTDNPFFPFWSPDSKSIAFSADQKLKRLDLAGGAARILADAPTPRGGTWNADNTILFAPGGNGPLFRISAAAGGQQPVEATRVEAPQQASHRFPHFLPDGKHFLFLATGTPEGRGIYLGELDSKDVHRLVDADAGGGFVPPDRFLFVRQESLFAQRLDLKAGTAVGEPSLVAERVNADATTGNAAVSVSSAGLLSYRTAVEQERQLMWFDRSGKPVGVIGEPDKAEPSIARVSPNGGYAALSRTVGGNIDVWLIETARGAMQRLTTHPARDSSPVWSPDGNRIAYHTIRKGPIDLYLKTLGSGTEELLLESSESKNVHDWSSDGRYILYSSQSPKNGRDLFALEVDKDGKPGKSIPVTQSPFEESVGKFSPDGRWIAFQSSESGKTEIYVQPFPGPGPKTPVSTGGGGNVAWGHEGRELFFTAPDGRIMGVPITLPATGSLVKVGTPLGLFTPRIGSSVFTLSPDGQRFLITTPLADAPTPPITIVLNWAIRD